MSVAVILVGGFGTRLRPLTLSKPKPLVEFVNKPIVSHQIDALVKVGVKHIILAISYLPGQLKEFIELECKRTGVTISTSIESYPLDTAGPLGLVSSIISSERCEYFFVFNCDVICSFPLDQMIDFHKARKAEASILVTKVSEPSRYGVIVYDKETGQIDRFVEKPKTFISNRINAGIYLFSIEALQRFKSEPMSMEKTVFPAMSVDKRLYAFELDGFWMDVGMPKDFLLGTQMYLKQYYKMETCNGSKPDKFLLPPVHISRCSTISEYSRIGPNVVIGLNVKIGQGVRLQNCTIMNNAIVGDHSWISTAIIGWNCKIGKWVRIENNAVLGENVTVSDEVYLNGVSVLPHKNISSSVSKPIIIM